MFILENCENLIIYGVKNIEKNQMDMKSYFNNEPVVSYSFREKTKKLSEMTEFYVYKEKKEYIERRMYFDSLFDLHNVIKYVNWYNKISIEYYCDYSYKRKIDKFLKSYIKYKLLNIHKNVISYTIQRNKKKYKINIIFNFSEDKNTINIDESKCAAGLNFINDFTHFFNIYETAINSHDEYNYFITLHNHEKEYMFYNTDEKNEITNDIKYFRSLLSSIYYSYNPEDEENDILCLRKISKYDIKIKRFFKFEYLSVLDHEEFKYIVHKICLDDLHYIGNRIYQILDSHLQLTINQNENMTFNDNYINYLAANYEKNINSVNITREIMNNLDEYT